MLNRRLFTPPPIGDVVLPSGYTRIEYLDTTAGGIINTLVSPQAGDCVYIDCELAASNGSGTVVRWVESDGSTGPMYEVPDCGCSFSDGEFYRITDVGYSGAGTDRHEYLLYSSGGLVDGSIAFPSLSEAEATRRYSLLGEKRSVYSSSVNRWYYYNFAGYVYRIIFFSLSSVGNRMDLVPAQQDSSGKEGLYDVVNGTFYTFLKFNFLNSSGNFTYPVVSNLSVSYQVYLSGLGGYVDETASVSSGSSSLSGVYGSIVWAKISPFYDSTYYYTPAAGFSVDYKS